MYSSVCVVCLFVGCVIVSVAKVSACKVLLVKGGYLLENHSLLDLIMTYDHLWSFKIQEDGSLSGAEGVRASITHHF